MDFFLQILLIYFNIAFINIYRIYVIITSRKSILFLANHVYECRPMRQHKHYWYSIFGKLEHFLYLQETFQLGLNIAVTKIDVWKKPTKFIILRFQNIGITDPQVCSSVAFWHWIIDNFVEIYVLLARVFRKWNLMFVW